jgi:putative membrane protein
VSYEEAPTERSLVKGLVAGLIGGLVATAVKSVAERIYPPRVHGEPEPPEVLAEKVSEKVAGHPLDESSKTVAGEAIHWGFGAAAGAFYGVLAEFYPAATAKEGASFGLALMTLTHESALPAMGLSAPPEEQTTREHTSEATTHLIWGVAAERVRSMVRPMLD